ncbi:hypothetical protein Tco_0891188 [Tanacetum coccineum]|uniref:Uncharacterized protein n=1 Tax=Tanacetum coccineum TaxID=301880 RepID=A0ABQ5C2J5_9ASTR
MIMADSVIIISSDSSDESVGSPPSRVILFGDIPTVIPSTSVVAPETSTIAPVISSADPCVSYLLPVTAPPGFVDVQRLLYPSGEWLFLLVDLNAHPTQRATGYVLTEGRELTLQLADLHRALASPRFFRSYSFLPFSSDSSPSSSFFGGLVCAMIRLIQESTTRDVSPLIHVNPRARDTPRRSEATVVGVHAPLSTMLELDVGIALPLQCLCFPVHYSEEEIALVARGDDFSDLHVTLGWPSRQLREGNNNGKRNGNEMDDGNVNGNGNGNNGAVCTQPGDGTPHENLRGNEEEALHRFVMERKYPTRTKVLFRIANNLMALKSLKELCFVRNALRTRERFCETLWNNLPLIYLAHCTWHRSVEVQQGWNIWPECRVENPYYPTQRGQIARIPVGKRRAYALGGGDVNPGSNTVTGSHSLLNDHQ